MNPTLPPNPDEPFGTPYVPEPGDIRALVDELLSAAIDDEFELGSDPRAAIVAVVPESLRHAILAIPDNPELAQRLVALTGASRVLAAADHETLDEFTRRRILAMAGSTAAPSSSSRVRATDRHRVSGRIPALSAASAVAVVAIGAALVFGSGDPSRDQIAAKSATTDPSAAVSESVSDPSSANSKLVVNGLGDVTESGALVAAVNANAHPADGGGGDPAAMEMAAPACVPVPAGAQLNELGSAIYAGSAVNVATLTRASSPKLTAVIYRPETCEILRTQQIAAPTAEP